MNILIVGCGMVGTRLATALCRLGHDVSVVDKSSSNFDNLGEDFTGITVAGIPMDSDVLEEAGIKACDALVAVTSDDNFNIVISQMAAKVYKVPRVVTRILDPAREGVFKDFGLKTICPTKLTAGALLNTLLGQENDQVITFGTHSANFSLRSEKHWVGKMLYEIPVHEGEMVFGLLNKEGKLVLANNPEHIISEGDKIIFSGIID